MAGQIIKRGDRTWVVRVFTGRGSDGKRRYLNKTIKGNKKDAENYLNSTLTQISTGTFVEPVRLTVDEYLKKWLATAAKPRLRERSLDDYTEKLRRYVEPVIGGQRLSDVRSLDVQSIYSAMAERKLSARTIRYTHSILASAFKQAVKWNLLLRSPCDAVELPRLARSEMLALSPEAALRFLDAASKDGQGIIFVFALATGMRPGEYLALKWSDLDWDKETATVRRTLVWRKGGGWAFGEPKTSRSRHTMRLPVTLLRALKAHRRIQGEARLKAGPAYENNDLVFAITAGTPHNLRNLTQRHFRPILTRAGTPKDDEKESEVRAAWPYGLTRLRLYDLRHSCATLLLAGGENPKVVSERLGHASIVLTLDTYSHVLPSMQQAAAEKLETILFQCTGTR